eukprot:TRINITY_DN3706_c0_g1_i3.p1 TRINITY_DN3706_c0_g1~~TRINITY_DN3706_c0_g1_i3.p1  ORF type:complete len:135 (+),score=24.63 TRINITY_DN3706_c0_g1_i3:183-587(+)
MSLDSTSIDTSITTTNNTRKRKLSLSSSPLFNIDAFPSEILVHIFSMTVTSPHRRRWEENDIFEQLTTLSLVCKRWSLLSSEPSIWKYCTLTLEEDTFPENLKILVHPKFCNIHSFEYPFLFLSIYIFVLFSDT